MKLELMVRKDVSHVELVTDERCTLGIAIRDGTDDEAGPVIKKIKAKSVAERSYAVAEGDVILSLNGREVMGAKGKDIHWMLKETGPNIDLNVQYEMRESCLSRCGVYRKHQMTTKLQNVGGSFGFVLRKKYSRHPSGVEYPLISNIKPGGPADKDGLMQDGDRLLKVDDVNLSWLSLPDIATILQERVEAEFTFEYNITVLDFPKPGERKIDLVIDIPIMDLGIGFCTHPAASHEMCIGSIRMGSVAERCGIFCEGDVILSVNGIDVECLTISKANSLLRYARKNRKISYVSAKEGEMNFVALHRKHSTPREQSAVTSASSIGIQTTNHKHFNTPADSGSVASIRSKSHLEFCPREQVKAIKTFQDILKHMTELKQSLSRLTHESFDANKPFYTANKICTRCNDVQHSIKLCASCLAEMNVKCAESMDFLRNMICHFVAVSIDSKTLQSPDDSMNPLNDVYKNPSESGVSRNLIYALTKTLPKTFAEDPELTKSLNELAEKIFNADTSCNSCKNDINSVSVTVQKLLLLISLNANTTEIKYLIYQLLHILLETKFACDGDASILQSSQYNERRSETRCSNSSVLSPMGGSNSSKTASDIFQNVGPRLNVSESNDYEESNIDLNVHTLIVNQNEETSCFGISDVQNSSEYVNDLDDIYELNAMNISEDTPLVDSNASSLKASNLDDSISSSNSEIFSKIKKFYTDKGIAGTPAKVWKSLDSLLTVIKSPQKSSVVNRNDSSNSTQDDRRNTIERNPVSAEVSVTNVQPHSSSALESNHPPRSNKRNDSESNTDSAASSSKDSVRNRSSTASEKIRRETVDVKIVNDGGGFGFVLGFSSPNFSQTLPVPIITAIKPKSPAEKVGVLQKKDRVLAIDHKSIVNMPLNELENLKRRVFNSERVTLTVEFDVVDTQMKFGSFDVMLEKSLKIGLMFHDMKKGYPMVVAGVVKGSAAYRSGQLFPGDKVTFLKCFRNEEFDPVSQNYSREETVKVTVQRDPSEGPSVPIKNELRRPRRNSSNWNLNNPKINGGVKDSFIKSLPSHSNPFSFNSRPDPQSGVKFILKRTSVRSAERKDSLVLEQEVTLFRDPISWDFGFLVGENPETGQAYVTDIRPGGPASASGVIKKFDRIMEVNGVAVGKSEERSVLSLLTQANDKMDLLIRRLYHEEMNNVTLKS